MTHKLFQIEAPHFTAGMVVDAVTGVVVASAPILAWSRGKNINGIIDYCARKTWKITMIAEQ